MRIPLALPGVNRVHLDSKVKAARAGIGGIKINITAEIHKPAPDRGIGMLDIEKEIGMHSIQAPLLARCLIRPPQEKKQQKR